MNQETDWHGYSIKGKYAPEGSLHIGRLPGRKSIALYWHTDGIICPVAFFTKAEGAKKVQDFLDVAWGLGRGQSQ